MGTKFAILALTEQVGKQRKVGDFAHKSEDLLTRPHTKRQSYPQTFEGKVGPVQIVCFFTQLFSTLSPIFSKTISREGGDGEQLSWNSLLKNRTLKGMISMTINTLEQKISVRKRDKQITPFNPERIKNAISSAFRDVWNLQSYHTLDKAQQVIIGQVFEAVIEKIRCEKPFDTPIDVERIQDYVELILMRQEHYKVAKSYILYRENRAKARQQKEEEAPAIRVKLINGDSVAYSQEKLKLSLKRSCQDFEPLCSSEELMKAIEPQLFDRISSEQIRQAAILAAKSLIEKEPAYDKVAANILLQKIYREIESLPFSNFSSYIQKGVEAKRLHSDLLGFDHRLLEEAMEHERDRQFSYQGLQTLYDRYLIRISEQVAELPQFFWMRVSMGLALNETDKNSKAVEFYHVLSSFDYISSTPTLFNSGTCHPQLSSCYLSTVQDDLNDIFRVISDDAKLSKWAGGIGNDWTNVRATQAHINGTNGKSQGVIPFLKVVNDTAVAVNQGGKRKGAICCYLETWHLDLPEFLDLRKNTGDDRRRTHDMHTANWIPDLFMKRVEEDGEWTLFSPDEVPDLHDLYGRAFDKRYEHYEREAKAGKIKQYRTFKAIDLWRKMLSRLFETGHPWITWKDPSNIRGNQKHAGVIHSSNLCTEILLPTSKEETAVCNLGSVNLRNHIKEGKLDVSHLEKTIATAIRMLDNVIDINFYPTPEARESNLRHRPIGLGMMGFQDALYLMEIPYCSQEAIAFADSSMETISYFAIKASSLLAKERGSYPSFKGSNWDLGLFPHQTMALLEEERGIKIPIDQCSSRDWKTLLEIIRQNGMRNSHVLAIAPTATISQIVGVSQSIEPQYTNLFTKSNLSGEFTSVNHYLVETLKSLNLWDQEMLDELKYHDGSVQAIPRIPQEVRERFRTAFEVGAEWLIRCAAARQKWIDMGQSLNLYLTEPSGRKLDEMYRLAWKLGLKTTYYLRTRAATQVEKSTLDINKFDIQPKWMKNKSASSSIAPRQGQCSIDDPTCEACQ